MALIKTKMERIKNLNEMNEKLFIIIFLSKLKNLQIQNIFLKIYYKYLLIDFIFICKCKF